MQRVLPLILASILVLGAVSTAWAVDHDMVSTGEMRFSFVWADNADFMDIEDDGESEDDFFARQRYRNQVQYVTENMKAVVYFEIGEMNWGFDGGDVGRGSGADLGADGVNVETRRAYIQFMVPDTKLQFRVGIQGLALPNAVAGSPILGGTGTDVAAAVASYKFNDMVSATGFWVRAMDDGATLGADSPEHDEYDVFGLAVPVNFEGGDISPYALVGSLGKDAVGTTDDVTAWWAGFAFSLDMFDPFMFMLDAAYGAYDSDTDADEMGGWYLAAELDYKMDMMTPGIIAWWSSGNDDDAADGSEAMPEIDGNFRGTSTGFFGSHTLRGYRFIDDDALATWGAGVVVKKLKLVDRLSHILRVVYLQGTNDEDAPTAAYAGLTTEDSAWEVNFDSTYMIYENLAAILETGYINVDLDGVDDEEDAWKVAFTLKYSF